MQKVTSEIVGLGQLGKTKSHGPWNEICAREMCECCNGDLMTIGESSAKQIRKRGARAESRE